MKPEDCSDMKDIRAQIDRIDHGIVCAIGERRGYVQAAAKFKTSETTVRAPERFAAMLGQRRLWAQEQGVDPDMIEKLFQEMVGHFIREELDRWKASVGKS